MYIYLQEILKDILLILHKVRTIYLLLCFYILIESLLHSQIKLSMFNEESYEKIFTQKISNKNIEVIRKFFIFPCHKNMNVKPYSSLIIKNGENASPRKTNPRMVGGFQLCKKSNGQSEQSKQKQQVSQMVVRSRKAPSSETAGFLEKLTTKINRQIDLQNKKLQKLVQQNYQNQQVGINKERLIANLLKFKKQSRAKYSTLQTPLKFNFQAQQTNPQLPKIEKRLSAQQNNSKQTSGQNLSATPTIHPKRKNNITLQFPQYSVKSQRQNNKSIIQMKLAFSSKIISGQQLPRIPKGYLSYDQDTKQFLQAHIKSIEEEPKVKKKLHGISASNYLIIDRYTLQIIAQKNSNQQIQIASLTKIMTCYLSIMVCQKYKINPKDVTVRVSDRAEEMPGTSAELQAGDILTLNQLLYALMLPSGNDASIAIADTVGKIIQKNKRNPSKKTYFQTFIAHMNLLAKQIGIQQNYQNSSGLQSNPNYSSPKAVTILTALALRNQLFYQIINCKQYEIQIKNERFGLIRKQSWKNTNKLLWKGWEGVKTGTTQSAGHCLMSCKNNYIISVFNCETLNKRFTECCKIYEYISQQQY